MRQNLCYFILRHLGEWRPLRKAWPLHLQSSRAKSAIWEPPAVSKIFHFLAEWMGKVQMKSRMRSWRLEKEYRDRRSGTIFSVSMAKENPNPPGKYSLILKSISVHWCASQFFWRVFTKFLHNLSLWKMHHTNVYADEKEVPISNPFPSWRY